MKKIIAAAGGLAAGVLNGLLGAGGGMIIVPLLRKSGLEPAHAHATSISVILPICLLSSYFYLTQERVRLNEALPYLPWGVAGALLGGWLLPRINKKWLQRCFGVLMLWAAIRMLIK